MFYFVEDNYFSILCLYGGIKPTKRNDVAIHCRLNFLLTVHRNLDGSHVTSFNQSYNVILVQGEINMKVLLWPWWPCPALNIWIHIYKLCLFDFQSSKAASWSGVIFTSKSAAVRCWQGNANSGFRLAFYTPIVFSAALYRHVERDISVGGYIWSKIAALSSRMKVERSSMCTKTCKELT